MLIRTTAYRYAKALFELSGTTQEIQKRYADLEQLVSIIQDQPSVMQLLCYPEFAAEECLKMIEKWLNRDLDTIVKQFLRVLIKRKKMNHVMVIFSEYHKLVINDLQSLDVHLESLKSLSELIRKKLLLKLENKFHKKINLIETINSQIMSGFVLLIGNERLDVSLNGQMAKLKKRILKGEP